MKTIAEQIADLEATRAAKAAEASGVMQKSLDEGRSTDQAEAEQFDTLESEIKTIDGDLTRLKKLADMQKQAAPVDAKSTKSASESRDHATAKITEKLDPGIEFARFAMCQIASKGNQDQALRMAQTHYGHNERVVKALELQANRGSIEQMLKAAVNAGSTIDSTWASPLVDYQNFSGDFVEYLRPQTILGKFGTGNVPSLNRIPFNVRIAGQTSGGAGYWVGEGKPKPLTAFDFNSVELGWAKVANIAVLTDELVRFSNPSAERLVRDSLADALRARLDVDFIDPGKAAVTNVSPASITNGVTPITPSGTDADAVRRDLQRLWAPFIAANNAPTTAVYIMSATQALALSLMMNPLGQREFADISMNGGTLNGVPVIVSEYVDNTAGSGGSLIILVNARDVWLADDGGFTIDASREASLQMDDAPTNASYPVAATSLVSMFQTNSVAVRVERYINWQKRRSTAVQYIDGAAYGTV